MTDMNSPVLFKMTLPEREGKEGLTWTHVDVTHPDIESWLKENVKSLDHHLRLACIEEEVRPRLLEMNDALFIVLRGINLNENADPEDMISIRISMSATEIYTFERRKLKAIVDLKEQFLEGKKILTSGDFLANLIERLFMRMQPFLAYLDEKMDLMEEHIIDGADIEKREVVSELRREAIVIRRYLIPQKEVMMQLKNVQMSWISELNIRHFVESRDRIFRYVEDVDIIRERAQIVKDEISSILSDKLNKNMYVLSVIASLFLPLGFLTGLFGANLGGIPGSDNMSAFAIFCFALVGISFIQIIVFKMLKWF
jgi:zinc transporter